MFSYLFLGQCENYFLVRGKPYEAASSFCFVLCFILVRFLFCSEPQEAADEDQNHQGLRHVVQTVICLFLFFYPMPTSSRTLVAFSRRKDAEGDGVDVLYGNKIHSLFFFVKVEDKVCRIKIWEDAALVGSSWPTIINRPLSCGRPTKKQSLVVDSKREVKTFLSFKFFN